MEKGDIYRHSKSGKDYEIICIAKHSETLEEMVVYQAKYAPFQIWVRPLVMFLEVVQIDGVPTARFVKI